jgi:MOSC domain-containing protein YiiM
VKPDPGSPLRRLIDTFPNEGRLESIVLRPEPRKPPLQVEAVHAIAGRGLAGDHRSAGRAGSRRQVTLIQHEHLAIVAHLLRRESVDPVLTRRNLVVSGINVLALKDQVFAIGEVLVQGAGPCEPCSRMETNLGSGGYNAMRGHGGITARILSDGVLRLGDTVRAPIEVQRDLVSESR